MIKDIFGILGRRKSNYSGKRIDLQTNFDKKLVFSLSKSRMPTGGQIKYIFRYLGNREKIIFSGLIFLFCIGLAWLGIRFYFSQTEITPKYGGEYVEGLIGIPQYVNPILAQANDVDMDLSKLIFSGLFKYNEKREVVQDLSKSYELSEDKKVYTVQLKDNLRWHDGESLTASDVVFTVASIQDALFRSPLYTTFYGVSIEKIDDNTVRFHLKEPYAPFLGVLTFGILPEHLWQGIPPQSANLAEYNIKPVGSGPFRFKSLTKDKSGSVKVYALARNEDFYGKKPYLEKMIFKFYPDFTTAMDALKSNNIEGINFVPQEFRESFSNKKIQKCSADLAQYAAVFFNQKKNQALKDGNVRRALAMSVNKAKIVSDVLGGDGEVIDSPILPGQVGYSCDIKKSGFDTVLAAQLLDKAGYKLDGGVRKKKGEILKIVLTTIDRHDYAEAAEIIKNNWMVLGVMTEIKVVESSEMQKLVIKPRDYEALIFATMTGADADPFPFWHSSQVSDPGLNFSLYANRRADKLIEEARSTSDKNEQAKKYIEFQNILAEDVPAIFLYNPRYDYIIGKDLKGVDLPRMNAPSDRFLGVENWYKKMGRKWK